MTLAATPQKDQVPIDDLPILSEEFRRLAGTGDYGNPLRDQLLRAASCIDEFVRVMQSVEMISLRRAVEDAILALLPTISKEHARLEMQAVASFVVPATDTVQ